MMDLSIQLQKAVLYPRRCRCSKFATAVDLRDRVLRLTPTPCLVHTVGESDQLQRPDRDHDDQYNRPVILGSPYPGPCIVSSGLRMSKLWNA